MGEKKYIDEDAFKELNGILGDGMRDFVSVYLGDSEKHVTRSKEGLANQDWHILERSVHTLVSSSYAIGARKLSQIAKNIQTIIEDADDADEDVNGEAIAPLHSDLLTEYDGVKSELLERLK